MSNTKPRPNTPEEQLIADALTQAGISYERERLDLDFWLPDFQVFIESKGATPRRVTFNKVANQLTRADNIILVQGYEGTKSFIRLLCGAAMRGQPGGVDAETLSNIAAEAGAGLCAATVEGKHIACRKISELMKGLGYSLLGERTEAAQPAALTGPSCAALREVLEAADSMANSFENGELDGWEVALYRRRRAALAQAPVAPAVEYVENERQSVHEGQDASIAPTHPMPVAPDGEGR